MILKKGKIKLKEKGMLMGSLYCFEQLFSSLLGNRRSKGLEKYWSRERVEFILLL